MSRSFDSHHVHTRSIKVDPQSANDLLRSHNLLVKIIWSGFGEKNHASEQHPNTAPSCGQWDVFDWKYLVDQLNNPAHNRPVYGLSDNGHHHNYTVMGDQRDRRRYFDPTTQQIVYRAIHSARGRSKPGIETIKAGSYTLLPPHGQMTYCRGLNPTTGRTARSGTAHYNSTTRSFPGFQIGWLFSADSADGGVFKHCCETDMFARRLPWLGNNAACRTPCAIHPTKVLDPTSSLLMPCVPNKIPLAQAAYPTTICALKPPNNRCVAWLFPMTSMVPWATWLCLMPCIKNYTSCNTWALTAPSTPSKRLMPSST